MISEIHECIADACGETGAKAIEQFAPSRMAVCNPARYESSLRRLSPALSSRVIRMIEAAISRRAGVEIRESEPLSECMKRVSLAKGGMSSIISR